jgi:anti-sigma factor RsiW
MAVPIRPDDDAHAEAEELLPWYSTGQLDDEDRALVEKHLATCVACQRQLRFDQKMVDEFQSLDPQVDSGWHRLRGRIEQDVRRPSRPLTKVTAGSEVRRGGHVCTRVW